MNVFRPVAIAAVAFLAASLAHADPSVTARLSATEVSMGNAVLLSIEIAGLSDVGGAPDLQIPDFDVQRAGQTHSFQWINGQSSALTTFNYQLTPLKTGSLAIPALTLSAGGKSYSTQPLTLNVTADTGAPATGGASGRGTGVPSEGLRPLFMTANVDTDHAYVGQPILLRVQFLVRPDVHPTSQARYSAPDMTGFIVEQLDSKEYTTNLNGAQYQVTEIPYVLYPTSDGNFAIGSAQIEVAVRAQPDPFDPNSFFQSFFGRSEVARLNTRAIPISVRSLPKNKPAEFSGAVGRYHITSRVDAKEPEVGKPFNLLITIDGIGNVKALKEPVLPELKGFRRYETISTSKVTKGERQISGSKEFKILLIPQVSGQLMIPEVSFAYFNPSQHDFVTDTAPAIPLMVKPGTGGPAEPVSPNVVASQAAESVRVVEKDIRFIKSGTVRRVTPPLFRQMPFWIANALPPLFALGALLIRRRSQVRRERAPEFRSRSALKNARRTLSHAKKQLHAADQAVYYGAVHAAVTNYLADKLGMSAAGLVRDDVDRRLAERGVPADLREQLREILDDADMARFAPAAFETEHRTALYQKAERAVTALNEVL